MFKCTFANDNSLCYNAYCTLLPWGSSCMRDAESFFENLYREYYDAIAKYCIAMLEGDVSEGELCAHEVFDQALADVKKLINHPNVVGWLKKTAMHRVRRNIRDRKKRAAREIHITDVTEKYLEAEVVLDDYDTAFYSDKSVQEMKEAVLAKLNSDETALYEYRFVQGLTFKEIAPLIGLSESATRMRTVRLEQYLRGLIEDMFE